LAELMGDLFGVRLVPATIARMSHNCARRLQSFMAAVRACVNEAKVKHLDETGFRIGGQTKWLHIASTRLLTSYRISGSRGSVPEHVSGTIVHDHWKPYYTITGVLHALCNAHHLRELKALIDIEKEDWARKMQVLLRRACHATNIAPRARGGAYCSPHCLHPATPRNHHGRGDRLPSSTPALGRGQRRGRKPRRVGRNLLLRLQQRRDDVLRFLSDPDVPFTNTQAERDARMMKLRQKISGGFRSRSGADDFAIARGAISTAKKQKWNILETLTRDPQEMIYALRSG
jgi:transposase